jgi:hypothetical protein
VDQGKAHTIPEGTFDVGDGYLEPESGNVFTYRGAMLRKAGE